MRPEALKSRGAALHVQTSRDCGYFTVVWSPIRRAEKYTIVKQVPSMAGLFELFYRTPEGRLQPFHYEKVWYGGLRNALRRATDPVLLKDRPETAEFVAVHACYFRYFVSASREDLDDVEHFFRQSDSGRAGSPERPPSGRFRRVFLHEISL